MPRGSDAAIGTEKVSQNGYRYRKVQLADKTCKWELVSRLIAEERLGRPLESDEYATFIDGDKENLDPANIIVRIRGRASLTKRLAQVEARIAEYIAIRDDLKRRIEKRASL